MTIFTGLNSSFSVDAHKREAYVRVGGKTIHVEGLTSQRGLDAGQFNQVFKLQAAHVHRAVSKLLHETLQGFSNPKTVQAVSFLDVVAMRLGKARLVAAEENEDLVQRLHGCAIDTATTTCCLFHHRYSCF